jgi:hypothetical protein
MVKEHLFLHAVLIVPDRSPTLLPYKIQTGYL